MEDLFVLLRAWVSMSVCTYHNNPKQQLRLSDLSGMFFGGKVWGICLGDALGDALGHVWDMFGKFVRGYVDRCLDSFRNGF